MTSQALPRTAAATRAANLNRAKRRAADPDKRDHALETVGTGLATGAITPEDLAEHIRRVVDTLPPLTEAQRAKLSALLRPTDEQAAV